MVVKGVEGLPEFTLSMKYHVGNLPDQADPTPSLKHKNIKFMSLPGKMYTVQNLK